MTNKEIVIAKYPKARVCAGDNPEGRIIMAPGLILSSEHRGHNYWDEMSAENDAWADAARRVLDQAIEAKEKGI